MYQGHYPDGSSIQRHSAGSHYPFVVGYQEGRADKWFVLSPNGEKEHFDDGSKAFLHAETCAIQYHQRH